jgi:ribosomal 30S subunit maturation factor RimM
MIVSIAMSPKDIKKSEPVFIYFDELPVPFFIEQIFLKGSTKAFLKLEDVDTLADAEELVGREIYLSIDEEEEIDDLSGLLVVDAATGKEIGEVLSYMDIPSNPCIEVVLNSNEQVVVLPCNDDLVKGIDPERGEIFLIIPEGLI